MYTNDNQNHNLQQSFQQYKSVTVVIKMKWRAYSQMKAVMVGAERRN